MPMPPQPVTDLARSIHTALAVDHGEHSPIDCPLSCMPVEDVQEILDHRDRLTGRVRRVRGRRP